MNLFRLFFPENIYCIACGNLIIEEDEYSLCKKCFEKIRWCTGKLCKKCGKKVAQENPKELCRDCLSNPHIFEGGYACALYDEIIAEIIRGMKYKDRAYYSTAISKLMENRYFAEADPFTGEMPEYDFVASVPMNENKKKTRGYDQAELIACCFAKRIGIPYQRDIIQRKKETPVMSSLGLEERMLNLRDAFAVNCDMMCKIKNSKILIVDDVYTTGSTADACAKEFVSAGAEKVDIFVFAIGDDLRRGDEVLANYE